MGNGTVFTRCFPSCFWSLHLRSHFLHFLRCICERQDAVQEILQSDSTSLNSVRTLLLHLPDLERGICSIYHKKVTESSGNFTFVSSLTNKKRMWTANLLHQEVNPDAIFYVSSHLDGSAFSMTCLLINNREQLPCWRLPNYLTLISPSGLS